MMMDNLAVVGGSHRQDASEHQYAKAHLCHGKFEPLGLEKRKKGEA